MTGDELIDRILNRKYLEQQEDLPVVPCDPTSDMTDSEVRKYCLFLFEQVSAKDKMLGDILTELKELRKESSSENRSLHEVISSLQSEVSSYKEENCALRKENRILSDRLSVVTDEHFGSSKSQKGIDKKPGVKGRNDDKGGFDGTSGSLSSDPVDSPVLDEDNKSQDKVYHGPSRKGWKYTKYVVGDPVVHLSDRSQLPAGTQILSSKMYKVRDVISQIVEHHFEHLKVKYADGRIETVYLAHVDDAESGVYKEIVPGTHITANLLSYLLFNKYQMSSPSYRETRNRLSDMSWDTCRQNLSNWSDKGAIQLNKLIPALKSLALQAGSDVNVDETWCRYQTHYGHKKTYMWCLVNKKANIVIFFYEDCTDADGSRHTGGRRRKVLTDFLGDAKLRSLQSDGYNVYMYLDDELTSVDHLCCMAHARAKFKTAFDQGCDRARFFLLKMGSLYKREEEYVRLKLPAAEIKRRRNDEYTNGIVDALWKELYELLALPEECMSDLMRKALNYLRTFWKQLFRYRTNGEYTIDNLAAERAIRPLTNQRKNSLFFCSTGGALNSAIYNTFIETCKQVGVSFRDYFRQLMQELFSGRTDYENLLPQTIGLNLNKK